METNTANANRLDPLMNLREVAKCTGRSVRHLWREIASGKLSRPVPGRPARLFESDVVKYLKKLRDERDGKSNNEKE
jgi:predicted DNA-binding transcriptional regulator AlpA